MAVQLLPGGCPYSCSHQHGWLTRCSASLLSLRLPVSTKIQQWPLAAGSAGAHGPVSRLWCTVQPFCLFYDWNVGVVTVVRPKFLLYFVGCGSANTVSQLQPPSHLPNGVFAEQTLSSSAAHFAGEGEHVVVSTREAGHLRSVWVVCDSFISIFCNFQHTVVYTSGQVYT